MFPEETPERWEKIASRVPGKNSDDVQKHYEDLVRDLREIDSGLVELPNYEDELDSPRWSGESGTSQMWFGGKAKERETERRKGVPWTPEEHRLVQIINFFFQISGIFIKKKNQLIKVSYNRNLIFVNIKN